MKQKLLVAFLLVASGIPRAADERNRLEHVAMRTGFAYGQIEVSYYISKMKHQSFEQTCSQLRVEDSMVKMDAAVGDIKDPRFVDSLAGVAEIRKVCK